MRMLAVLALAVMALTGYGALMSDASGESCGAPAPSTETTAQPPPIVIEGTFLGSETRRIDYPAPGLREGDGPVPVISQDDEIFRFRIESTTSPLLEVGGIADVRMFVNRRYVTEDGTQMQSHTSGAFSRAPVEGYRYRVVADWLQGFEGELLLATKSCGARGRLIALDEVPRQPPTTMPSDRNSAPGDGDAGGTAVGSAEAAPASTTTDGGTGLPAALVATAVLLVPLVGYATWATRRQ